ncbi:MAG: T9SS type A sorting domain-containing protein [Melioribacteraceae bacterium]|nr:T9SS type A sorting domain-containing protein [Melioribacteraceae bacterium]
MNLTTDLELILDYPVTNNFSSEAFDGIKLTIQDEKSRIDTPKSGFTRNELNPFVSYLTGNQLPGVVVSCNDDWTLIFNNLDTLSDGSYLYPGDTVQTTQLQNVVVPFKLINNDYLESADYLISENNPITRGNGKWDFGETIILRPQNPGSIDVAYGVQINKPLDQTIGLGDTLQVITFNGITNEDKYLLKPNSNFVLSVEEIIPSQFSLSQNYPNPFNPSTIIEYSIPNVETSLATSQMQNVTLKVYDILGREVAVLVNEQQSAGKYRVNFNASNLSSGIYLYQLKSGNHVSSKKMLLIK